MRTASVARVVRQRLTIAAIVGYLSIALAGCGPNLATPSGVPAPSTAGSASPSVPQGSGAASVAPSSSAASPGTTIDVNPRPISTQAIVRTPPPAPTIDVNP